MIYSMTGFGKAVVKSKYGAVTVEAKAFNHKFFELSAKLPNGLAQFEEGIKRQIQQKIKRGKVYLNIELSGSKEGVSKVTIDENTARRYQNELLRLKRRLRIKSDIRLEHIIAFPGVITSEVVKTDSRRVMPHIKKALDKALGELAKDRSKEGSALRRDLEKRAKNINKIIKHIEERSKINVSKYKGHLSKMIKELTGAKKIFDKERLEQEVALFAKNCDISEEITRIKSHLSSLKESLDSPAEVGKKLDFIAQELHREANTIGSKSTDFKISKGVIQLKSDIEKIREQVKNIE